MDYTRFKGDVMIKSEFPEKIYEMLINCYFLSKGFDIYIPSQNKESKLGYDALFQNKKRKIGIFQYKVVSEYIRKPKIHSKANKVFNFEIYKSNKNGFKQHNLLVKKHLNGITCGYLVPCFVSYDNLYNFYHSNILINNSKFIKPTSYIYDNNRHYVSFDTNNIAFQHSKEQFKFNISSVELLVNEIKENGYSFDQKTFTQFFLEDFEDEFDPKEALTENEKVVNLLNKYNLILILF